MLISLWFKSTDSNLFVSLSKAITLAYSKAKMEKPFSAFFLKKKLFSTLFGVRLCNYVNSNKLSDISFVIKQKKPSEWVGKIQIHIKNGFQRTLAEWVCIGSKGGTLHSNKGKYPNVLEKHMLLEISINLWETCYRCWSRQTLCV